MMCAYPPNYNIHFDKQMLLRQVADSLQTDDDPALIRDVAFREKDAFLLREECLRKFDRFSQMLAQKEEMRERLIALKEELCRVSPEALEEIEREAIIRKDCQEEVQTTAKKICKSSKSSKKNDRKKKSRN